MPFRESIAAYIAAEAKPREKFGHQPRLYELTKAVGKDLVYDDDIVYAAVWLHDLGVFTGHRPQDLEELKNWDNTRYAMEQTPKLLERFGFPGKKIDAVVEAIRTHQPQFTPQNIEGIILRDADILEQLGTIGILRTVCKVGRDTRFEDFTSAIKALEYALKSLPDKILLESTRVLAQSKIQMLREFLTQVHSEAGALLF